MITLQQFDNALKIISDYKSQLEKGIFEDKPTNVLVDIQKKMTNGIFFVLQYYYSDIYNINLEWKDLKTMDLKLLKALDFKILHGYRGFGKSAEIKLKNTIDICSINSDRLMG
ncbi:MAG: hypothetical protein ACOYBS_11955 [Flavobacterium sp.]